MKILFLLLPLSVLCGCGTATHSGNTAAAPAMDTEAVEVAPAPAEKVVAAPLTGVFENSSCGERKFLRRVELQASGKIMGTDFIAPCPAGARCVWSGIAAWRGTWNAAGPDIAVSLEPLPSDGPGAMTLPEGFVILSGETPALAERAGALVCPYQRVR